MAHLKIKTAPPSADYVEALRGENHRLRVALNDAVSGKPCEYGPKCEDCWVCRAREVLGLLSRPPQPAKEE